jgi:hypothetical protein
MLEAGLSGLACLRAPRNCPPPFTSDGLVIDDLPIADDLPDYVARAVSIAGDLVACRAEGQRLRAVINDHYCGIGWQTYLNSMKIGLPKEHVPTRCQAPHAPAQWEEFWLPFLWKRFPYDPMVYGLRRANALGLQSRMDFSLALAALAGRSPNRESGAPSAITLWLLGATLNNVISQLPMRLGVRGPYWLRRVLSGWYYRTIGWRFKTSSPK